MRLTKRTYILKLILLIALFASCEKVIDIDIPDTERKLVINGVLSPDSLFTVNISQSLNILDSKPVKYINNATVSVRENGNLVENLTFLKEGYYMAPDYYPAAGNQYEITVTAPNLPSASADIQIPVNNIGQIQIDTNAVLIENDWDEFENYTYQNVISFYDEASSEDFYWFEISYHSRVTYNDEYYTETWDDRGMVFMDSDDPIIDSWVEGDLGILFNDHLHNGKKIEFMVEFDSYMIDYADSATIYYTLKKINKDLYLYILTHESHVNAQNNPLAEPVQVYTNVENGYGILGGLTAKTDSLKFYGQGNNYWK